MRNRRMASRLLALALTVLMLASCFVALPAMAEETTAAATTTGPKVLWEHNFANDGTISATSTNATTKTLQPNSATGAVTPNGYFVNNDVFYYDCLRVNSSTNAWNGYTAATYLNGGRGMLDIGGMSTIRPVKGVKTDDETPVPNTTDHPNSTTFFNLMYGLEPGYNTPATAESQGSAYFMEFDYIQDLTVPLYADTKAHWKVDGVESTGTLYNEDAGGSGAVVFRFLSGGQMNSLFRVAKALDDPTTTDVDESTTHVRIYTYDNVTQSAETALKNQSVYYIDSTTEEKVYIPTSATYNYTGYPSDYWTSTGYTITDRSKAYRIKIDKKYRIGVKFEVTGVTPTVGTDGTTSYNVVDMKATVYIKAAGEESWDACVGSTEYKYYPVDVNSSATEYRDGIMLNDSSYVVEVGGNWTITACNGDYHASVMETQHADDATRYDCECLVCGETWLEREVDGQRYVGDLQGNACEGTYYVWVPKDTTAVGVPFADSEYTTKPADHTYDSNSGLCSVCGKYEFEGELSQGFYISGSAGSKTALQSNYVEDATRGDGYYKRYGLKGFHIFGDVDNTVGGGSAYKLGNLTKPFTVSFDLKVDSVDWNTAYSGIGNFKELITLVNSSNGNPEPLLDIGKAPDGTNILVFRYDFTYGNAKEKEDITVGLVRGDDDSLTVDDGHDNYEKLMQWFAVCAAPGQNINTAESGRVMDDNDKVIGYNYFTYTQDTTDETALTRTYTFHDAGRGLYEIPDKEWFNLKLTFVPDNTGSSQDMLLLYINGELVGMRPYAVASSTADADWQSIRVHDVNDRFTIADLNFDNVGFRVHESLEEAYAFASNQMFTYAFDRFQSRVMDSDYQKTYFGAAISSVYTRVGAFDDSLDSDLDLYSTTDYGTYAHYDASISSSSALSVSLSTKLGATGSSDGTMYNLVSAHKYEINLNVAVPNTDPIVSSEGKPLDFVRLSKFRDAYVKVVLLQCDEDGYLADGKALYRYNDESVLERCSPYTTVTNNVPAAFSNVRVVVDEENNVYSVYVDGSAAYYYDSATKTYKPYVNMTIPAPTGTGVTKAKETNEDGELVYNFEGDVKKYHDYTAEFFETLVAAKAFGSNSSGVAYTYSPACEYVRFFQAWTNFYLKDVAVSIIPDSDIEMIGVQEMVGETIDLRFVAAIDDIYVHGIRYNVEAYRNGVRQTYTTNVDTGVVFSAVNDGDDKLYAYNCKEGNYLSVFKILGIPKDGEGVTYKFVVTPYTLDVYGNVDKTFEPYTAIYNGAGEYLGSGQPFEFDLSEYKDFAESPSVLLELKAGSDDYNDFYVYTRTSDPSGRYYIRYRFGYIKDETTKNTTNTTINIRSFRINTAHVVKVTAISDTAVTCTEVMPMLGSGEISLAIKEYKYGQVVSFGTPQYESDGTTPKMGNAVQDFIGGYHGDEHIKQDSEGKDMFSLVMDGKSYVPGQGNLVVEGNEIVIEQTTLLDRWAEEAGTAGQVAEHTQIFTINEDGIDIDRTVTWKVDDFLIENAYVMMLTLLRCTTTKVDNVTVADGAICEKVATFKADGTQIGSYTFDLDDAPGTGVSTGLNSSNVREIRYSSATSGASAIAKVDKLSDDGNFASIRIDFRTPPSGADNKLYVPMTATGGTGTAQKKADGTTGVFTKPSIGETWMLDTFFKIDYVNPNN